MRILPSTIAITIPMLLALACAEDHRAREPAAVEPGAGGKADHGGAARSLEVLASIEAFNAQLSEADRSAKYCKMAASAFSFYRGSNHLYWMDLADDVRATRFGDRRTRIWLQGDLHAFNFGAFDDDRGRVVYDLNDFDESVIADYQHDLWRLAISVVLLAEENAGFSSEEISQLVEALSESYLDTVSSYRGNDDELEGSVTESTAYGRLDEFLQAVEDEESRRKMLDKQAPMSASGHRNFDLARSKLESATAAESAAIRAAIPGYSRGTSGGLSEHASYFEVLDVARRVGSGTGSLGTPRYWVLIEGRTDSSDDDRILDVKRQGAPASLPYLADQEVDLLAAVVPNHAARVVLAQRAMALHADDHLGVLVLDFSTGTSAELSGYTGDYSVRERSPFKASFPTTELSSSKRFIALAEQWAAILAGAHARADKDHKDHRATAIDYSFDKRVDLLTDGHHKAFRALVAGIAASYAAQVNADFASFAELVAELDCP